MENRRWLVPEVVQTSAMDCGPAALKCLLEGFNIPVSYGRLREACQTNIDGTSIDMLEEVANQLGVNAKQVMVPIDHIFLSEAAVLPAMVVVRHSDGATHFVVVWRRHGAWLQVMDPAIGRRWVRCKRFAEEVFRHEFTVLAQDWLEWAASDEFLKPLQQRLSLLAVDKATINVLIAKAQKEKDWFGFARLDASVRLVNSLVEAGGITSGHQAVKLIETLVNQIDKTSLYASIPRSYWSVTSQPSDNNTDEKLILSGGVLLQVKTKKLSIEQETITEELLAPELEAALNEKPTNPGSSLLALLKDDGLLSPYALIGALTISVAALLIETLLFRGIFDIAWELKLADQRMAAVFGLVTFVTLLLLIEVPIAMESLRFGRHLETRLRMALLRKLPNLTDRYFQSRPISDMAERSHSIALTRQVPSLGIHFVQTIWDIIFTLGAISLIDPASSGLALLITALAISLPLLAQPLLNERDLRVRSHSGALFSFYLDALLGLVPIRTHRAELSVRREHEGLLVEWAKASRSLIQYSLATEGIQSLICMGCVGLMLFQHFTRTGGISGGDLLLVYWALKLPAIGNGLTSLFHQYPAQRNILLRLLEPLSAPEELNTQPYEPSFSDSRTSTGVEIVINSGDVVVAGHSILQNINLSISPGEHIAIVGPSGAGKSSLLGLLLGWHRLAGGQLRVDGLHLSGNNQQILRQKTAWVDPAVQIWNRSFLDNLTYSSDEGDLTRIANAIDTATLRGVLQKLPSGLQTYLGEGGALLSGGEGQRIRLARALMQTDVQLVLLDEPFRGMDRSQRHRLLNDTRQWWQTATLICVTHDVAETLTFKRVLVVENGEIIEDGEPNQLAARDSRYRDLLEAEKIVRRDMWKNKQWRKIQVQDGCIKPMTVDSLP